MSKLTDQLKGINVTNSDDFYGPVPYVWYRPADRSRTDRLEAWMVHKRGANLSTYRSDDGNKAFVVTNRTQRKARLDAALGWAVGQFGYPIWKKDPFGSYGPLEFVTARLHQLREALRDGLTEAPIPQPPAPHRGSQRSPKRASSTVKGTKVGTTTAFVPGQEVEWHGIQAEFIREVGNQQCLVKIPGGATYQTQVRNLKQSSREPTITVELPAQTTTPVTVTKGQRRRNPPTRSAQEVRKALEERRATNEFTVRSKRWNDVVFHAKLIGDTVDFDCRLYGGVTLGVETLERLHVWLGEALASAKGEKEKKTKPKVTPKAKAETKTKTNEAKAKTNGNGNGNGNRNTPAVNPAAANMAAAADAYMWTGWEGEGYD